jgi:hypothetical protein
MRVCSPGRGNALWQTRAHHGDVADLLLDTVLEQLEVLLAEIGDRPAARVPHDRIDDDGRDTGLETLLGRWQRGGGLRLRADDRETANQNERREGRPEHKGEPFGVALALQI